MPCARAAVALLSIVLLSGCGSCEQRAEESDGKQGKGGGEDEPKLELATIEGKVVLAEGAELPSYEPSDLGEGPGRPETPEGCPPLKKSELQPMQLTEERALSNVLVTVTGFQQTPEHEPEQHRVFIRDCRLTPVVVGATRGDELVVENESDYPFLPTLGKSPFMQALMKGQSRSIRLDSGGVQALTCGFAATCGRADVIVQYHPVHGITGEDGTFRLDNVPPGDVEIHAWHPLLQEARKKGSIDPKGHLKVQLEVEPSRREPQATTDGGAGSEQKTDASAEPVLE